LIVRGRSKRDGAVTLGFAVQNQDRERWREADLFL